jgi:hypothetical protein
MRLSFGLLLLAAFQSAGCGTTSTARQLRPPKVEEFALPTPTGKAAIDPPNYPEEKRLIALPTKQQGLPASMRDAGGGAAGGTGGGMPIGGGGNSSGQGGMGPGR